MNQLKKDSIDTTSKWKAIGAIDPTHIDTTFITQLVVDLGKHYVLKVINAQLENYRFKVKFAFPKVKSTLQEGDFSDLVLFYHDLKIPKSAHVPAIAKTIHEVFDVTKVTEKGEEVIYEVNIGEGSFAYTIEEIVYNINRILGPKVQAKAKQIGINDFYMTFKISLTY